MAETLLKTKYGVPALRPQLVPRSRLQAKLHQALETPLTLVSAPPGFGKTTATLVAARALQADAGIGLAWLTLDADDNEPARFWRYVGAALQSVTPGVGAALSALGAPQPPPLPPLLASLLNELADQTMHYLLVLDDYHLISASEIHAGLTFLLDHAPSNLHLMLVTRADPPLALHRLRARGQLLEIRAADLRFDQADAAALLTGVMALALTEEEVARLLEQTEGWVAGLQLAGLALQGAPPGAAPPRDLIARLAQSNRYIIDYLAEEVLAQQSPRLQAFLCRTSILHRLGGALCDAVNGESGSQELLETLARRNLFVAPVAAPEHSDGQPWFRYHQLFADLLQGHLRRQFPAEEPQLHQRAAAWYEAQGDIEAAIEHGLAGADYARVVQLLDRDAGRIAMEGRALTIERWLQRLPADWRHTLPRANLAFAWALLLRGRYGEMTPYLQQADAAIAPDDLPLRGEFHALQAALADTRGRSAEALEHARAAIAGVPPANLIAQAVAHTALAGALRAAGEVEAAIGAYEQALPLCRAAGLPLPELLSRAHLGYLCSIQGQLRRAEAATRPVLTAPLRHPVAGAALTALGMILLEWNRLEEAAQLFQQAQALARQSGHAAALVQNQILRARLHRTQGDAVATQVALDEATALLPQGAPAWIEPLLVAERVQFWLEQGAIETAERLLAERSAADADVGPVREALPLAQARLLHRQGRHAEARAHLDAIVQTADAGNRQGRLIEALLLRALASAAQGDASAALADVRRALALAEPEGYIRTFLDGGPLLAALIAQSVQSAAPHDSLRRYAARLLAAFPTGAAAPPPAVLPLPEPLTEREIEVLHLMARGLTYQQIADTLVISINTVRHHVKGIYGKLQVDTRTLALEQARALGLL